MGRREIAHAQLISTAKCGATSNSHGTSRALRVEINEDNTLVEDEFLYRVELIPHGQFRNMVLDVADVLPEEVQFLGFLTEYQVENDPEANPNAGPQQLTNTETTASYDADTNTVSIERGQLTPNEISALYFKVKLVDFNENIGVTNFIGNSGATIVPSNEYPLSLAKADSGNPDERITDLDAIFQVKQGDEVIVDNVYVQDGQLRTAGAEEGTHSAVTVEEPGTYTIEEVRAPAGYQKTDEVFTITIDEDGVQSPNELRILNTPLPPSYAIGDVVWIDHNNDGLQGDGEFLEGVTVELLDGGGNPVEGVAPQVTDANGRYIFDELPEGTYRVQFTLTDEQERIFQFTQQDAETDDANADSDSDPATGITSDIVLGASNSELIPAAEYDYNDTIPVNATEGIDPTWDAGVVRKVVSVGDYVWFDKDRDGEQGDPAEEPGIPGVVLEILDPNGDPVLDDEGNPRTTTTDEEGKYLFDGLPVIHEDESYTVRVVQDDPSTQEALKPYVPTISNDDGEGENDSSTWEASSVKPLTEDGAEDLTLDFGFVLKTYAIGDVVWIDSNKDGIQDPTEHTLPGVTVTLVDADGEVVATTVTDENGLYKFDELVAGTYRVHFELTPDQAKKYTFTQADARSNGADDLDSDADPATGWTIDIVLDDSNASLTTDYAHGDTLASQGIDPTWDAGVVLIEVPADPTAPVDPDEVGPKLKDLPETGSGLTGGLIALTALLMLLGGAALMLARRRARM